MAIPAPRPKPAAAQQPGANQSVSGFLGAKSAETGLPGKASTYPAANQLGQRLGTAVPPAPPAPPTGAAGLSHTGAWKGTPDPRATPGTNGNPGTAPGTPEYGTESGPGILENWFNERANGTDPSYEYAMKRGMDSVDSRMAAGGSYNSGARGQQLGDFAANMGAQRMGQLDSLAGGAAGEHQGRLNSMFNYGLGMAGSQAGLAGMYDTSVAQGMSASDQAIISMMLNKAGVDAKANQAMMNNIFAGAAAFA